MSSVRVRFAPSPTGFFHIGSARTALFNWLYARHTGGTFVLRIEDTDRERNTDEALQFLLDGLRWLGLDWDEGPEKGGEFGPYFQSQRDAIYQQYLDQLVAANRAYEEDGAVWFRIEGSPQVIEDAVRGRVERTLDKDFVIRRSNGTYGFHFVNVVDDISMAITHVIRGEDHLSNTARHTELFAAFGAATPVYAHIPLILKTDGKGKMSKRDEGSLIEEYQRRGFLPEAVRNYLCLLGWSPKDDREILPIDQIIELFDLPSIQKNNARFDEKKLAFINTDYLRNLPAETFTWLAAPRLIAEKAVPADIDEDYLQSVLCICQEKVRDLEGLADFVRYFFTEDYMFDAAARDKIFKKGDPLARVEEFLAGVESLESFDETTLEALVQALCEKHGVKSGEYIHATRFAVSGQAVGPSFYSLLKVLGKQRVISRLQRFRESNQPEIA